MRTAEASTLSVWDGWSEAEQAVAQAIVTKLREQHRQRFTLELRFYEHGGMPDLLEVRRTTIPLRPRQVVG